MKKTILFLVVCLSIGALSFGEKPETLKFKKLAKFKLDKTQLKVMTKANLPIYQIKDGYAYPGKGSVFYATKTAKGGRFIIVLNEKSKIKGDYLELNLDALPFEVTEVGDIMEYCSCGSNISATDGDHCQQYQLSDNSLQCGGGCEGDNQGRSCSYTRFDTRTGKAPID